MNSTLQYQKFLMHLAVGFKLLRSDTASKKAAATVKAATDGDKDARQEFSELLNKSLELPRAIQAQDWDAIPGDFWDHANRVAAVSGVSKGTPAAGSFTPQQVAFYRNLADDLTIDMNWMPAFAMDQISGSNSGDIIDFDSFVAWDEYNEGEPITQSSYGQDSVTNLRERRFGVKVGVLTRWLETNQRHNVNNLIEAIRRSRLSYQADFAYSLIGATAGVNITTAAGATLDQRVTALNNGLVTLMERNDASGYNINSSMPVLAYGRLQRREMLNQAIARDIGSETNNTVLQQTIVPYYTSNTNIPLQSTTPADAVILVLPGFASRWLQFRNMEQQASADFDTHSEAITAQEYWNAQCPAVQREFVNFA